MSGEDQDDEEAAPAPDAGGPAAMLCADLGLAQRLARLLERAEIPAVAHARDDGRGILAIPEGRARYASQILSEVPGVVLDTGAEPHYRVHDPARDPHLFDHAVLRQSPVEIRERGAEGLAELRECVLRGTGSVRDRALASLARLGADAWPTIDALILRLVRAGSAPVLGSLLRATVPAEGRGGSLSSALAELPALARSDPDATVRQLAVRALGALRVNEAIPALARALADESPDVAIEADDAFLEWGAEDVGFDPDLDAQQRAAIARARASFTFKR